MFGLVFRLESQGLFKVSELGMDAMQIPGVKWRGHSLKMESTGRVEKRTCSMENRGRRSKEEGGERAGRKAGEGPEITKTRLYGRGGCGCFE